MRLDRSNSVRFIYFSVQASIYSSVYNSPPIKNHKVPNVSLSYSTHRLFVSVKYVSGHVIV